MNELSDLIKETPEGSLAPSSMWGHSKKMTLYEPGSRLSPDTRSASALISDLSASRTVRNNFLLLLFKLPSLVFCYSSTNRLRYLSWHSVGALALFRSINSWWTLGLPFLPKGSWGHRDASDMACVIDSLSGDIPASSLPLPNMSHSLACPLNYLWWRTFYFSISAMFWTNTLVKYNKNISAISDCYKGF